MKKILISCTAGSLLLSSGCSSAKKHFQYPEAVTAAPTTNTFDLGYQLSVNTNENKVHIAISLENPFNVEMPLLTNNEGHLFEVWLEDEEGQVIEQFWLDKGDRESLAGKEKSTWETTLDVNRDENIFVHSRILLKSNERNKFVFLNEEQRVSVQVSTAQIATTSLNYTPKETVNYIYKTNTNEEIVESFMYISGNRIQSFTEEVGVKIYSNEADGLYVLATEDATGDIDGTEYVDIAQMNLLIPYPVQEGYEWEIGDMKYEVTDADIQVKTPFQHFQGAVEVTETDKKGNKKYLYFHNDVGLLKVKQRNKKQLVSKTIYELVGIEKRTSTVNNAKSI